MSNETCSICHIGYFMEPSNGQDSYLECNECGAIKLTYVPLPHQVKFHKDTHKIKMFAGGYGSGKSHTGAMEVIDHILRTPGGMTLIGASTKNQLDQTAKDMFFKKFPAKLIESYRKQQDELMCKNGHKVLFRTLDEEGKIRSLNLSCCWIEEASEVKFDIYVQLLTRLRNSATKHHQMILTTNPDLGWVRTEILLKADQIHNAEEPYYVDEEDKNPNISVHIAPTRLNPYLPPDFISSISKNRPEWWVRRYLHGSFSHSEGMVYPQFPKAIIDPVDIPDHWERGFAMDFGLRDPTACLLFAIDPETGTLHFYREHYEAQRSVKYHSEKIHTMLGDIPQGRLLFMMGDPAGHKKSERDLRSLFDHYAEYGVYLRPASNKIADGISKVYTYFEMDKIRIHSNLVNFIREGTNYKYPEQELEQKKNAGELPVDKDNHLMDCLRYCIQELPDNPADLVNPSYSPYLYRIRGKKEKHLPHALQSNNYDIQPHEWTSWY